MSGNVLFSGDETKRNLFNSHGRSWCWLGKKKRLGPQHVCQIMIQWSHNLELSMVSQL